MSPATSNTYVRYIELLRDQINSFNDYPFCLPAVRNLMTLTLHPKVTFLVGENGTGKSTLLEAIAIAWGFNPEGGTRNFTFSTRESHSNLSQYIRLVKESQRPADGFFLRAESFYNLATNIEELGVIDAYGGRSLHEQSHGESFFATFMNRFSGNGFYVLDEPEAALSPLRQMALLSKIHELVEAKSQFIIATHSPILLAYPDAYIYQLNEEGLKKIQYEETETYQVMKNFLDNREKMLKILLDQ